MNLNVPKHLRQLCVSLVALTAFSAAAADKPNILIIMWASGNPSGRGYIC